MADAAKTVAIIFEGQTSDAQSKIDALGQSLDKLGSGTQTTNLDGASQAIERVGTTSDAAKEQTAVFGDALKKVGEEAGIPRERIEGLTQAFEKLGVPTSGAAALAAAAIGAFALVASDAGSEAFNFKTKIENLTGSAATSGEAFEFIQKAVRLLETDLGQTADAYARFLTQLQGTGLSTGAVQNAFVGIVNIVDDMGGSMKDAEAVLKAFAEATKDGDVSIRDLDTKIREIPNGINIFADSLGVSVEQLREMAENGQLGREEIGRFSEALRNVNTADLTPVKGAFNDLINIIKQGGLALGAEGGFQVGIFAIEKGIRTVALAFDLVLGAVNTIATSIASLGVAILTGDLAFAVEKISGAFNKASESVNLSISKLFGIRPAAEDAERSLVMAGESGGAALARGIEAGTSSLKEFQAQSKAVNEALRALGIDPRSFVDPIQQASDALNELVTNPQASGDQLLSGFLVTLDRISSGSDLTEFRRIAQEAFADGKLSAEQYQAAVQAVDTKQSGLWDTMSRGEVVLSQTASAMGKQAEETKKAEKAANDFALRMEQIASNERIKLIEAQIKLDIAQVEADAKVAVAAFESITETVGTTTQGLTDMLGILAGGTQDWASWRILTENIETQNLRLDEQLKLQRELLRAQIELAQEKTRQMQQGGALVQIDGAGLQPHLEAFMWEILRTIQVRVNQDGLEMLVGV